jgi:hypothetical protein
VAEPADAAKSSRAWRIPRLIVAMAGVLLIVDLLALPWHHYAVKVDTKGLNIQLPTFELDRTAVQSPHPSLGFGAVALAGLMVALVLVTTVERFRRLEHLQLLIGPTVFGLLAAKALVADYLGSGAWLGLLLGAVLAYGGFRVSQEAGGRDARPVRRRGPTTEAVGER